MTKELRFHDSTPFAMIAGHPADSQQADTLGSVEGRPGRATANGIYRLSAEELTSIMTSPLRQILQRENDESRELYWQHEERGRKTGAKLSADEALNTPECQEKEQRGPRCYGNPEPDGDWAVGPGKAQPMYVCSTFNK